MEITSEVLASCAVVRPVGTLDRRTAPLLEAALQELAGKGHGRIVLDLSGVGEMSSAGLRVIISAAKLLRNERTGGDLRLVAPGERVIQVLELAGLQSVLRVYSDSEPAIASFAEPPPTRKRP
jgi:anti-sigma B factor antagonist